MGGVLGKSTDTKEAPRAPETQVQGAPETQVQGAPETQLQGAPETQVKGAPETQLQSQGKQVLMERIKSLTPIENNTLANIVKREKIAATIKILLENGKADEFETLKNMLNLVTKIDVYYNGDVLYQKRHLEIFMTDFIKRASKHLLNVDEVKRQNNVILSLTKNNWKKTVDNKGLGMLFKKGWTGKSNTLLEEEQLVELLNSKSKGGARTKRMRYNRGSRRNRTRHRRK